MGKSKKLFPIFCGPLDIVRRIGHVVYELELSEDWRIHNVFYVCLLRKYMSYHNNVLLELSKVACGVLGELVGGTNIFGIDVLEDS